jgi:hypothetical protein
MYWQGFWFRAPRLARCHAGLFLPSDSDARQRQNVVIEEIAMATPLKDTQQRSAAAAVKAERALDKVAAMQEYEAEELALRANTARLRALRLAKEAENTQDTSPRQPAKKKATQDPETQEPAKKKAVRRPSAPKRIGGQPPR